MTFNQLYLPWVDTVRHRPIFVENQLRPHSSNSIVRYLGLKE